MGGRAVLGAAARAAGGREREIGKGRGEKAQTVVVGGGEADLIWAMLGGCDQEQGVVKSSCNGWLGAARFLAERFLVSSGCQF